MILGNANWSDKQKIEAPTHTKVWVWLHDHVITGHLDLTHPRLRDTPSKMGPSPANVDLNDHSSTMFDFSLISFFLVLIPLSESITNGAIWLLALRVRADLFSMFLCGMVWGLIWQFDKVTVILKLEVNSQVLWVTNNSAKGCHKMTVS